MVLARIVITLVRCQFYLLAGKRNESANKIMADFFFSKIINSMKYNKIIWLFLVMIFASCNGSNDLYEEEVERYKVGESKLILDDSTSIDFIKVDYVFENGREYLLHHNEFKKSIQVFDLESGEVDQEISYPFKPPFGIQVTQDFTAISLDSIFIFMPLSIRGSILINRKGEILDRYMPRKEESLEKSLINHVSFGAFPTLLDGENLRFIQLPLFEISNPANINGEYRFERLYNIRTNEITDSPESAFPTFYHNKIWPGPDIQMSRVMDKKGRIINSWKYSDSLVVSTNGELRSVIAKSDYKNQQVSPFSMNPVREEITQKIIEETKYYGIYYDEIRDLYYRTVQHPGIYEKNKEFQEMDGLRNFSIIVLDKDFNKLKEVAFPGGIYNIYRVFVGNRGFYLPKNNVMNAKLVEDTLSIDIFDFTKNE